jgi:hypothetical protein
MTTDPVTLQKLRILLEAESGDGKRVVQHPHDNPICLLSFDASNEWIVVKWRQYATSLQLRFIHEHMLEMVRTHGADRILGDDTRLGIIHSDDQRWILEDWLPRAFAAGLRAGASKLPAGYFAQQCVSRIQSAAPPGVVLNAFRSMDDARTWLQVAV